MEHTVDDDVLERLCGFIEFVETCPRGGQDWLNHFKQVCRDAPKGENCVDCMQQCLKRWNENLKQRKKIQSSGPETAADLKIGDKGRILKIRQDALRSRKLSEIAPKRGSLIEVEKIEPNGQIQAKIRGHHIKLRTREAQNIEVAKIL
jgi:DtxR family Mn-dependent transcriptional regulator